MNDFPDEPPSRAARLRADYLDPRDAAQRLADRDGVRRQAVGLGRAPRHDAYRRVRLSAVQTRRAERTDRQAFQLFTPEHGQEVGCVHGELLVRSDAARCPAGTTMRKVPLSPARGRPRRRRRASGAAVPRLQGPGGPHRRRPCTRPLASPDQPCWYLNKSVVLVC